jgi:hypothetical protein
MSTIGVIISLLIVFYINILTIMEIITYKNRDIGEKIEIE